MCRGSSIVAVKDDDVVIYQGELSLAALTEWVERNLYALLPELTQDNAAMYTGSEERTVLGVVNPSDAKTTKKYVSRDLLHSTKEREVTVRDNSKHVVW